MPKTLKQSISVKAIELYSYAEDISQASLKELARVNKQSETYE